jgi:V/A-type H+-transporting ATPase subunit D
MRKSGATRAELLSVRARAKLALQGRDLLEDKRTALLKELRRMAEEVIEERDALDDAARAARRALAEAVAFDSRAAVRSAGLAVRRETRVNARIDIVMGVEVPWVEAIVVERGRSVRGYGLYGTSARIDAAAQSFEREVDQLMRVATREVRLRILADEIAATTRRVNALSHIILPELVADERRITLSLEEREREERFRLRRAARRQAREEAS